MSPQAAKTELRPGSLISGKYRLQRQLGRGGFAPVWLAEEVYGDTTLRLAAVKLFSLDPRPRAGRPHADARRKQRRQRKQQHAGAPRRRDRAGRSRRPRTPGRL